MGYSAAGGRKKTVLLKIQEAAHKAKVCYETFTGFIVSVLWERKNFVHPEKWKYLEGIRQVDKWLIRLKLRYSPLKDNYLV